MDANLESALSWLKYAKDLEEDYKGKVARILELEAALAQRDEALKAALDIINDAAESWPLAWCEEHAVDDHMCNLDHKDELELAEYGLRIHEFLKRRSK